MLPFQRQLSRGFYCTLSLPSSAMGLALSIQIAALSWLLTTQYGLDIHDVGWVWAAGPLAGIVGQVLIGIVSDNVWLWHGRRRPFIILGGIAAALSLLALPNIDVISASLGINGFLGVAITVAILLDLSINISFNPTRSIIADVTPPTHERTRAYTWMQTVSGSFAVLAYFIGSFWDNYVLIYLGVILVLLMSVIPPLLITEPRTLSSPRQQDTVPAFGGLEGLMMIQPLWGFLLYSVYAIGARLLGWQADHYWIEGLCLLLTIVLIIRALVQPEQIRADGTNVNGFKKVLAAHGFTWLGVQSMFVYMIAFVKFNLPELDAVQTGQVMSMSFLVLTVVSAVLPVMLLEPMARRFGRVKVHTACIFSMALGYGLLAILGNSNIAIYLLMGLLGVGWAATISLPFAIMSQRVAAHKMGLFMGLFNLSVVLPQLVASVGIGKIIHQVHDKRVLFWLCAGALLLSALAWLRVNEQPATNDQAPRAS
ncbi:MFS transporter [Aestuariibacter halophilus]|uniref:MFS transporter n=1 Tax=Fluctibacter halophilus TaxID=226011 RepID=A0ABS8G5L0_9ALTE|nr:MFS transporter [Aestuariibacter halophilus]MCC2615884.1 MFS transporter [Aestuariibacter halophilus]